MELAELIPFLSGNVAALIFLYAWIHERKERMAVQDRLDRALLAVAGYRTEPDTANIVKMDNSPPDARAKGTYPADN